MLFFTKKQNKTESVVKAFTLIETMVSAFVISTVILGPLTTSINALTYARETKDTMIAIYLAQEALELLHHQQDSLYIRCVNPFSNTCANDSLDQGSISEIAWANFRESLGEKDNNDGVSCYENDSPNGCAFDFIDFTGTAGTQLKKYGGDTGSLCATLSTSLSSEGAFPYVCTGTNGTVSGYVPAKFSRTIIVKSIPTITGSNSSVVDYNSDLRVTVVVSLKRATGYTRQIKVVDFFHAHP